MRARHFPFPRLSLLKLWLAVVSTLMLGRADHISSHLLPSLALSPLPPFDIVPWRWIWET